jgi:hypothetical protein
VSCPRTWHCLMTQGSGAGGKGIGFVNSVEVAFNGCVKIQYWEQLWIIRPVVRFLNFERSLARRRGVGIFDLAHFHLGKLTQSGEAVAEIGVAVVINRALRCRV